MLAAAKRGQHQHRRLDPGDAHARHHVDTRKMRQGAIEDDDMIAARCGALEPLRAILGQIDDHAGADEDFGDIGAGRRVIFHQQHGNRVGLRHLHRLSDSANGRQ